MEKIYTMKEVLAIMGHLYQYAINPNCKIKDVYDRHIIEEGFNDDVYIVIEYDEPVTKQSSE